MGVALSGLMLNEGSGESEDDPEESYTTFFCTLTTKSKSSSKSSSNINNPPSEVYCIDDIQIPKLSDLESSDLDCLFTPSGDSEETIENIKERLIKLELDGKDFVHEMNMSLMLSSREPLTPYQVLESYADILTPYERLEIFRYKDIYFFGKTAKKRPGNISDDLINAGYDDERDFYQHVKHDHIAYRYETFESVGKGTFGEVIRAFDHKHQEFVAIKIIQNRVKPTIKSEKEVRILQKVRRKTIDKSIDIVGIKNAFVFRNHMCIVLELMSTSLFDIMQINTNKGFSIEMTRKFIISVLRSLKFLSDCRIMHGDIKPENILKCHKSNRMLLSDFGLGEFVVHGETLTDPHIQTRWFRAPEVILGGPYGVEVDMWSLGCMIPEILNDRIIFPGETEFDQLTVIMEFIGVPPMSMIMKSNRKDQFFHPDGTPRYLNNTESETDPPGRSPTGKPRGLPGCKDLIQVIGDDDLELVDFVKRCLIWDPSRRMTPVAALKHPWLKKKIPSPPGKIPGPAPPRLYKSLKKKAEQRKNIFSLDYQWTKPTTGNSSKDGDSSTSGDKATEPDFSKLRSSEPSNVRPSSKDSILSSF